MTKDEMAEACKRAKDVSVFFMNGEQCAIPLFDPNDPDQRIGFNAGMRAATKYWFDRFKAIEEIDTVLMTDEEISIGLSEYMDFSNQMKEALGHEG